MADFEFGAVQRFANLVDLEKINAENAYLDAKIGFDAEENEPSEICGIGSWYMNLRRCLYRAIEADHAIHADRCELGRVRRPSETHDLSNRGWDASDPASKADQSTAPTRTDQHVRARQLCRM